MRAFVVNLPLALLLAALGVSGTDIEPKVYEKGHFAEINVATLTNIVSRCYLVTPFNTEVDVLANETLKYDYLPNSLSSCRVRINDLDKNDEGLWSLYAVLPAKNDTVYEYNEQLNISIQGSDTSESVNSEESSKLSAEGTADSNETPEDGNHVSAEHPATSSEAESSALGVSGTDIEPKVYEKGHFAEINVATLTNIVSRCYLVTPFNTEVDVLANETLKYDYLPNSFSSCRVRINDLDKNDEGLWSLHAVLPAENDTVYEYNEQLNISIQGSETSESVNSEESSKLSAEGTADSDEAPEDGNHVSAEHPATSSEAESSDLGVSGTDIEPKVYEKGHFAEINVATLTNTVSRCYLVTPFNTEVDVLANETLKYDYLPNSFSSCRVRINDLDKNDEGLWSLHAVLPAENDTVYEYNEQLNISIQGSDNSESVSSEESSKLSAEGTTDSEETPEDGNHVSAEHPATSSEAESSEGIADSDETPEDGNHVSAEHPATSSEAESSEGTADSDETPEDGNHVSAEHPATSSEAESSEGTADSDETPEDGNHVSAEHPATSSEAESSEGTADSDETPEDGNHVSAEHPATSSEAESLEATSSEEEQFAKTLWLSDLHFITRTGLNVDINLPRTANAEKCTLTKPDGTDVDIKSVIPGVTVHSASDYVSCRVVVGPMEESLLGKWTLCGSYEENNVEHRRCQNAEIVWRNPSNPGSMWQTTIHAKFDHVVHFGGTLTPAVRGSGSVVSCHLVTPDDEDLVVTRDRDYHNVRLVQDTDSVCSIAIGPIADLHLGDWAIYGTFDSALYGHNEVRLPVNMELYDKDDPYTQAYNVTTLNPTQHVVNLGSTIPVEVTSTGAIDLCQFTMPSGQTYLSTGIMPAGVSFVNSNRVACQLSVGPITEEMIGEWQLVGKFTNRDVHTENRLTFTIIQEDPANPIEEDRIVQDLAQQYFDTTIGASHRVVIASDFLSTIQSCHIRTPEGLQYTIMEGFHIPGVEVDTGSNVACGVTLKVSENLIGTWTLMAREIRSSEAIERRLPFIIYVEETVEAVPNVITITEDNSFHVRLANPTELHDACKLLDNNGQLAALARPDMDHQDTCGFVVSSVDPIHNGTWNIVYGTKIIYKAPVLVNVTARGQAFVEHITWVEYTSVSQTIGPEEAVYCRVISPLQEVVFDGFGRCHVAVDRVMKDQHESTWTMEVGFAGRIVTEKYQLEVKVIGADKKPEVFTSVTMNNPTVELTCSVTSSHQKTGCLFRGPAGEVLIANQGVREDRYIFHVNQTSVEPDRYYYSCSLQIIESVTSDLGLWRCDLDADEENYYGFLTVQEAGPVLTAAAAAVSVLEGESAVLACSARAPLRYCYFRAPNGTIYNVQPRMSSPGMEYVGAGLDAGECGVRIDSLLTTDSGTWSCHADVNRAEQFQYISVFVEEEFQLWASRERRMIEAQVAGHRPVEYCRFVRFDGSGFTSDSIPYPYVDKSDLTTGSCRIQVVSPLDWVPWTVVTKIQGRDGEISRVTGPSWSATSPVRVYYNPFFMWLPLLTIMTGCLLIAAAMAPARNRRWAAERASHMRASMRDSMRRFPSLRKKPTAADNNSAA